MMKIGSRHKQKVNATLYEPHLFVAVKSGPTRQENRNRVRSMWMNSCRSGDASHLANKKKVFVNCAFVVGQASDESLKSLLVEEQHQFGDIISVPVQEGYAHMTAKTLWTMLWFHTNKQHRYLMITDDDVVVIFSTLLAWIGSQPTERFYAGHYHPAPVVYRCPDPNNPDPNCVSKEAYSKDLYPRFAGPFGFILSRDSALLAAQTGLGRISYPGLPGNVEGAMVGVLLDDSGVELVDVKGFIDYQVEMCPEISGQHEEIMVIGNAPQDIMTKIAENVRTKKPLCTAVRAHKWQ